VWTGVAWERKQNASWRNPYFEQTESDPVVMVSWLDAAEFCNWLSTREHYTLFYSIRGTDVAENWSADGYRLPTEAEWEYAARSGGKPLQYAWGNGTPAGNVADQTLRKRFPAWPFEIWSGYADGNVYTAPVGSYPPNELGLFDLSGNVWEWCNDWYEPYTLGAQADPRGAATSIARTLRGGGWSDQPRTLRVSFRSGRLPNGRGVNSGFRPARSIRVE
jgi:formylglycine-generating enzyme required for sulfatase activity